MSADPEDKSIQADLDAMKLPRGGIGFSLSRIQIIKIVFTAGMLALVILVQRPCSDAVGGFVTDMDNPGSGVMPKPDNLDVPGLQVREAITPGMSDAEVKAAIDRAWARGVQGKQAPWSWFDVPAICAAAAGSAGRPVDGSPFQPAP